MVSKHKGQLHTVSCETNVATLVTYTKFCEKNLSRLNFSTIWIIKVAYAMSAAHFVLPE